jgi:hypothetical protein
MKSEFLILALMMLIPLPLMAQDDAKPQMSRTNVVGSVETGAFVPPRTPPWSLERSASMGTLGGQEKASPPQTPKERKRAKPSTTIKRPPMEGSMVAYIDNAIVASQIRMRFDAAFHDHFPDRAEFFYAQCGCNPGLVPGPPALVSDLNFQQLRFYGEFAPINRVSGFVELPVRWIQPTVKLGSFTNQAGFGDVQAGLKFAMLASSNRYLTLQFQAYFPSGDSTKGLGTDHYSIEPALLYYQRVSDRLAVEAQIGGWHPLEGSSGKVSTGAREQFSGDVIFYGIGPSYEIYRSEHVRFAPVLELVGWSVRSGLETNAGPVVVETADGVNIFNLKIGARTTFGSHSSLYFGYGRALSDASWYRDLMRIEYRYSF